MVGFFQALVQLLVSFEIPAATAAVGFGALFAGFKFIYWHTLFEILGAFAVVFLAANIVNTIYHG